MTKHTDDKQTLDLKIGTPKGSFTASFPKTATGADVIEAAIREKGLAGGSDQFELYHGDTQIEPNRPLVSYHLKDGDALLLTAQGEGV